MQGGLRPPQPSRQGQPREPSREGLPRGRVDSPEPGHEGRPPGGEVERMMYRNVSGLFAIVVLGAFTHTSVYHAEIVLDHLFGGPRRLSTRIPVYALFTDPPLGRVGTTEKEALASGRRVMKATRPMSRISRATEMSETHGFAKLLVDSESDAILGGLDSPTGQRRDHPCSLPKVSAAFGGRAECPRPPDVRPRRGAGPLPRAWRTRGTPEIYDPPPRASCRPSFA